LPQKARSFLSDKKWSSFFGKVSNTIGKICPRSHSPLTTAATVESIFGASYFGVGRGVGGLIGGFAIYDLGVTVTFRCLPF
jgi:hypothetical protein